MRKTLQGGEWLLMQLTDKGTKADYGDIIVIDVRSYQGATAQEGFLIKRLIAKGGDKLYCKQGRIFIWYKGADGFVELEEPYAYYANGKSLYQFASYEEPFVVPEGKIFYLGDNRQNSKDSEEEYSSQNGVIVNETDIHGVVPDWAITYQKPLRILFLTETYFKQGE
jgi:signal peptidase I